MSAFAADSRLPRRALKGALCDTVARVCVSATRENLRAIILTGSVARAEATFVDDDAGWLIPGDVEFLLVFDEGAPAPSARDVQAWRREAEESLLAIGIRCHVDLGAVRPAYLRNLRPHIFAYELMQCGQVIWGDVRVLSLIPTFSIADIPFEDGWRMLCNRMVELLEAAWPIQSPAASPPPELQYRTVKLFLDMGSSLLLFAGVFAAGYAERCRRLRALTENECSTKDWPFPLDRFVGWAAAATEWKLSGGSAAAPFGWDGWRQAIEYAHALWRWELRRLTGADDAASDRELWQRWARALPRHRGLRGWLFVVRKRGWCRSWRQWPRWARLAWQSSPRYWIYRAASGLTFSLPRLLFPLSAGLTALDWDEMRRSLPEIPPDAPAGWRGLAAAAAWNYREFLVETRS